MEKENTLMLVDQLTKEIGIIIKEMEKENIFFLPMDQVIKEIGRMIKNMVKGNFVGVMEQLLRVIFIKEILRMI